jgi:hypothetical protein
MTQASSAALRPWRAVMRIAQAPLRLACERPLSIARPPAWSDIPSDGRPHLAIVVALFGLLWLRLHRSPVFLVRLRQAGMESVRIPQTFRTVPRPLTSKGGPPALPGWQ